MVFTNVFARVEPGTISQLSFYLLLAFSYLIHKWKKVMIMGLILLSGLVAMRTASAIGMFPGSCGTMCMANRNYYGAPMGGNYSYYPYPNLPFHSTFGPSPYYFRPYGPSPYQPPGCVVCMQRYQQFTQPWPSSRGMMFTKVDIPFRPEEQFNPQSL